jgi:hypothetical protein
VSFLNRAAGVDPAAGLGQAEKVQAEGLHAERRRFFSLMITARRNTVRRPAGPPPGTPGTRPEGVAGAGGIEDR